MRLVVCASLLLVAFAGCTDDASDPAPTPPVVAPAPSGPQGPDGLGYLADPSDPDSGAHTHDAWGTNTILPLVDGTTETGDCQSLGKIAADLASGAAAGRVQHGCAWIKIPAPHVVPEGTARLALTIDLEGTNVHEGDVAVWYSNRHTRNAELDPCSGDVCEWTIDVQPLEWDIPHSEVSSWGFAIEPRGTVGALDGTIDVYLEAQRIDDWVPLLGSAHIDHWAADAAHDFIEPGVMRLLDTSVAITQEPAAGRSGEWEYAVVELPDLIAPGTRHVTVAYVWTEVEGCPPTDECTVQGWLRTVGSSARYRGALVDASTPDAATQYVIYQFEVGTQVPPDSTYAETSQQAPQVRIKACPLGEEQQLGKFGDSCIGESVHALSVDLRVEIEAWKSGADIQRLKARLGL